MTLWVFNNGSSAHRGVWHAAENDLAYTTKPARVREVQQDVFVYHSKDCNWHQFESGMGYYHGRHLPCSCGLGTESYSKVVGKVNRRYHEPETISANRISVLCHQVIIRGPYTPVTYRTDMPYPMTQDNVGQTYDFYGEAGSLDDSDFYPFEGVKPPGPVCSRCFKKVQKNG